MNCYQHSPTPAVGICKTCFKAVCPECAVDVGDGLACKNSCEQNVQELNEMLARSAKIYGIGKHKSRFPSTGVLLWSVISAAMWLTTWLQYDTTNQVDYGSLAMAVLFTAGLGLAYFSSKRTGLQC